MTIDADRLNEARRAINALRLEVPNEVWLDVSAKVEAALDAAEQQAAQARYEAQTQANFRLDESRAAVKKRDELRAKLTDCRAGLQKESDDRERAQIAQERAEQERDEANAACESHEVERRMAEARLAETQKALETIAGGEYADTAENIARAALTIHPEEKP